MTTIGITDWLQAACRLTMMPIYHDVAQALKRAKGSVTLSTIQFLSICI